MASAAQRLLKRNLLFDGSVDAIALNPIGPTMIAIIDDDLSIRQALESLILSHGYQVRAFSCAEDYLAAMCLDQTECVLTDIHMAGMSGIDLLRLLKQQTPSVPVVLMTAFFDEPTRQLALASGAASVLAKPFGSATLISALTKAAKTD
jgi:FixJ family two-component response regulator